MVEDKMTKNNLPKLSEINEAVEHDLKNFQKTMSLESLVSLNILNQNAAAGVIDSIISIFTSEGSAEEKFGAALNELMTHAGLFVGSNPEYKFADEDRLRYEFELTKRIGVKVLNDYNQRPESTRDIHWDTGDDRRKVKEFMEDKKSLIKGTLTDYVKMDILGKYTSQIVEGEILKIREYSEDEEEAKTKIKAYLERNNLVNSAFNFAVGKAYSDKTGRIANFELEEKIERGKALLNFAKSRPSLYDSGTESES